jgi:hypothetical protein
VPYIVATEDTDDLTAAVQLHKQSLVEVLHGKVSQDQVARLLKPQASAKEQLNAIQ